MKFPFFARFSRAASAMLLAFAALVCSACVAPAQTPGTLDTTFDPGTGADATVVCVALQADGKVLLCGPFDSIDGTPRPGIARLNTDGSLDASFDPGASGIDGGINAVYVQPGGKIILCGSFDSVGGHTYNRVARLNADGSVDTSFGSVLPSTPGFGLVSLAVQPDGKLVLVGYSYDDDNGTQQNNVVRLNADGSLDSGFSSNLFVNNGVFVLAVQTDGKILLGGNFTSVNGAAFGGIVRVNADGSVDTSFNPASGVTSTGGSQSQPGLIRALALLPEGKIAIGGQFDTVEGMTNYNLARLNADGSLDTGFNVTVENGSTVYALAQDAGGDLIVAGDFYYANGEVTPNLARVDPYGVVDTAFSSGDGPDGGLNTVAVQPDGKIVIGGAFSHYNDVERGMIARIYGDDTPSHPPFFAGEEALSNGVYFLVFVSGNYFGYYSYLSDPHYIYHFDLGYEYVFDAADGKSGAYFYDFASDTFFYSSPLFPFPYLYDFKLNSVLYYYPDPTQPDHYNTNGIRYFYDFNTGKIISKQRSVSGKRGAPRRRLVSPSGILCPAWTPAYNVLSRSALPPSSAPTSCASQKGGRSGRTPFAAILCSPPGCFSGCQARSCRRDEGLASNSAWPQRTVAAAPASLPWPAAARSEPRRAAGAAGSPAPGAGEAGRSGRAAGRERHRHRVWCQEEVRAWWQRRFRGCAA